MARSRENRQLKKTIYPDGSEASYLYDAQGRTQEINVKTATGTTIQLLRSASYHPFGPVQQRTYGNGRIMTRTLNLNGEPRIVQVNASGGISLGYEFDEVGKLKTLRNANQTQRRLRPRPHLQHRQNLHRLVAMRAAHVRLRAEAGAEGRAFGAAEEAAAVGVVELHAGDAGGFAVGHAGEGAGDRGRDAASAAAGAAVQGGVGGWGRSHRAS